MFLSKRRVQLERTQYLADGLTPEQASEIMSVQIESETEMLGKDQIRQSKSNN